MSSYGTVFLLLRRFLWIIAFAFWMGGFSFYGGVVIAVGSRVVAGGEAEFGFITRQVTNWLNLSGGAALVIFLMNLLIDWQMLPRLGRWAIFAIWLGMAAMHGGLLATHPAMDQLLDPESLGIRELTRFHRLHKAYILMSSLQWVGSLVLLLLTLWTWRERDRQI